MSSGIIADLRLRTRFSNPVFRGLPSTATWLPPFSGCGGSFFQIALSVNHVPVHETHSAKVRKITTTFKILSLNRIVSPKMASYSHLYFPCMGNREKVDLISMYFCGDDELTIDTTRNCLNRWFQYTTFSTFKGPKVNPFRKQNTS